MTADPQGNCISVIYYADTLFIGNDTILTTPANTDMHLVIVKHNSNGQLLWHRRVWTQGSDNLGDIVSDSLGNIYVSGTLSYYSTIYIDSTASDLITKAGDVFARNPFLLSFDPSGNLRWFHLFPCDPNGDCTPDKMDCRGNTLLLSGFQSGTVNYNSTQFLACPPTSTRTWLASFDLSGQLNWTEFMGGYSYLPLGLKILSSGDFVTYGKIVSSFTDIDPGPASTNWSPLSTSNLFLARYNGDGTYDWGFMLTSTGTELPDNMGIDKADHIFITGDNTLTMDFDPGPATFTAATSTNQLFLASYDSSGNFRWAGAAACTSCGMNGIYGDDNGKIIATGTRGSGMFIQNYDSTGIFIGTGGSAYSATQSGAQTTGMASAYNGRGGLFVGGHTRYDGNFGSNGYFPVQTYSPIAIPYVAKFLVSGNKIKGAVFVDRNANAVQDAGEPEYPGTLVRVTPDSTLWSNVAASGYTAFVDTGNYSVSLVAPPLYYTIHPSTLSHSVYFSSLDNTDSLNNFALLPIPGNTDVEISLATHSLTIGERRNVYITCRNVGTDTVNVLIDLFQDTGMIYLNSSSTPLSNTGFHQQWQELQLLPGDSRLITVEDSISNNVALIADTAQLYVIATATGDLDMTNNTDTVRTPYVAGYDPNEKTVSPGGPVDVQSVANGQWLNYEIHFQNTGNAQAQNIIIADELDHGLDLSTLYFLGASDTCHYEISGANRLSIYFDNINLPDSASDFYGSCGFFEFRIKMKTSLQNGDSVLNKAEIYFDHNPVINTNTVVTRIGQLNTGIPVETSGSNYAAAFPNPITDLVYFEGNWDCNAGVSVAVFDIHGKQIPTGNFTCTNNLLTLHFNDSPPGLYFIKVVSGNEIKNYKVLALTGN